MKKIALLLSLTVALALFAALLVFSAAAAQPPEPPEVPFLEEWSGSGHADAEAEAFAHWNEDDPAVVPANCAKCHSTPGYLDFLGVDGSEPFTVENEVPVGTVVACVACHNTVTLTKTSVVMPSGNELTGLGDESRCMECHQGRASQLSVTRAISRAGVTDDDSVSEDLGFTNIHYFAAAATKYGTLAKGGYEYEGKTYDANFAHVAGFDTCIGCHNPHTLQVKVQACAGCHTGVRTAEDLKKVRMPGSMVDYDGDGNVTEGIAAELEGLQTMLYQAIQAYGTEKSKTAIVYDPATYPYFFIDTNKNGKADTAEVNGDNSYNAWTARLAKAAYNYQMSIKDPGAFAHGGKYIIQLLYDSIEDLNSALSKPVDLAKAHRIDAGHFAGSEEAFRHWDADGAVPGTCSKCHSAGGLPIALKDAAGLKPGNSVSQPLPNGFQCATCHDNVITFTRYAVAEVEFPSGARLSFAEPGETTDANLCLECHQGRESTVSVDKLIADLDEDTVSDKLRFLNVHYFAAGATRFGGEARGAYEYAGKEYVGLFQHVPGFVTCVECHNTHGLTIKVEECSKCHATVKTEEDLTTIRMSTADYDGDKDTKEGLASEINAYRDALFAAMQDYATNVAKTPIAYNPNRYPYFMVDTNKNGKADPDEGDQFRAWTPRLLKAAYNYQYSTKDPGAFAHNGKYILQVLYDSLEDMSAKAKVKMTGFVRPE
jgi:hypothetical protein